MIERESGGGVELLPMGTLLAHPVRATRVRTIASKMHGDMDMVGPPVKGQGIAGSFTRIVPGSGAGAESPPMEKS